MAKVLVCSDKGVERRFCGIEKISIPQSVPAHLIRGGNMMPHQLMTQRSRCSLVKEDSHAPQRVASSRSSSSETLLRMAQNSRDLFARYTREPLKKIIHPRAIFEVLKQRLNRDPGTFEQPRAANFPRHSLDRWALTPIKHAPNVTDTVFVDKVVV
jgi:hypothetical protein